MFEIHASLDLDLNADDILLKFGLEPHGPVQKFIDKSVIDYMMPYWAWDTGTLARDAYTRSDIGSGLVTYAPAGKGDGTSYAHYMYYGVLYTDELRRVWVGKGERKPVNTGIPLNYKKDVNSDDETGMTHIGAGAYPFERMKLDHLEDILEGARKIVRDNK